MYQVVDIAVDLFSEKSTVISIQKAENTISHVVFSNDNLHGNNFFSRL